ncbi:hypothetical protein IMSAGC015_00053 [Lachnospiraceae bacterium]|nr:hypothetical protein IMSAGC015_00053 [Lachnospiraceae bacterium]
MGMRKEKKSEGTTQAGHLNVVTVIAVVIAVLALGGSIFMFLMGSGSGDVKSQVSKKELKAADELGDEDGGVTVVGLEHKIVIAPSGNTQTSTGQTPASGTSSSGDYIFPNSDTEYLTDADVSGRSKADLRIGRNEIMARHGRIFDSADLKAHFESKSWYSGTVSPKEFDANVDARLNDVERANIEMIKKYE